MATNSFTGGAGTGALTTAGNWSLAANPVSTNDVVIGLTAYDLTGDVSAGGTVDLASMLVTNGWYGTSFGDVATPVTFKCTAGDANFDFGPRCSLANIAVSGTAARVRIINSGTGQAVLSSGTITDLQGGVTGSVLLGGSTVATTLYTCASLFRAQYNATAITTTHVGGGGTLISDRTLTTAYVYGFLRTQLTAAATSVYVAPGATFNLRGSGTHTNVYAYRGANINLDGNASTPVITNLYYEPGFVIPKSLRSIVTNMKALGAIS